MTVGIRIAASILAADFAHLAGEVLAAERGGADLIHVDVMDGRFVPEITIGAVVVAAVRRVCRLPIDVHLMVVEPERHVQSFVRAGASSITVHAEATSDLPAVLRRIRQLGARAAAALSPATPPEVLRPVLPELDMALLMTVNPGYAGQPFISAVLPKIRQLRAWIAPYPAVDLQVDGGITPSTAPQAVAAGANILVAASAIFATDGGIEAAIQRLRQAAGQGLAPT